MLCHETICGNDDDNEKDNTLRTRTTSDPDRPPPTKWFPMHAGKGPTTIRRRPLAVGPHVEPRCKLGPQWDGGPCPPGCVFVILGGATFTVGGVSSDLGRSAKVARGELTHTHAHTHTHTHTRTHTHVNTTRTYAHAHTCTHDTTSGRLSGNNRFTVVSSTSATPRTIPTQADPPRPGPYASNIFSNSYIGRSQHHRNW